MYPFHQKHFYIPKNLNIGPPYERGLLGNVLKSFFLSSIKGTHHEGNIAIY